MKLFKSKNLVPGIFIIGMLQYVMAVYQMLNEGRFSLWSITADDVVDAGPLRYGKDLFVILLAIFWTWRLPTLMLPRQLLRLIKSYFFWLGCIITVGLVGFLFDYSPLFFLSFGLRWLLLLHAAFGVFILSSGWAIKLDDHKFIFNWLLIIQLINFLVVLIQFQLGLSQLDIAFGSSRLTGLMGQAAIAGLFSLSIGMVCQQLDGVDYKYRICMTLLCVILAIFSGTRFAIFSLYIIFIIQCWEILISVDKKYRELSKSIFVIGAVLATVSFYFMIVGLVDRGGLLDAQLDKDGRIANFLVAINMISSANIGELFFGHGLGVGTNTAIGLSAVDGVDLSYSRFNMPVDNAVLTGVFQFGLLGSILFWSGILSFILFVKPKNSTIAKYRYGTSVFILMLAVVTGNLFEWYFFMMAQALALGAIYWSDVSNAI